MNQSTPPTPPVYTLWVDGVVRAIGTISWSGTNEFTVYAAGAAAVTSMRLRLDSYDQYVLNSFGTIAVAPQDITELV